MKRSLLTHFLRSIVLAATLAALLGAGTGCHAIRKASDDTVAYVRGELDTTLSHRFQDTVKATKAALEELKFTKVSTNEDALLAIFIVRTADNRKVEVKVTQLADSLSKVQIRVGTFGDESLSYRVLERINANF